MQFHKAMQNLHYQLFLRHCRSMLSAGAGTGSGRMAPGVELPAFEATDVTSDVAQQRCCMLPSPCVHYTSTPQHSSEMHQQITGPKQRHRHASSTGECFQHASLSSVQQAPAPLGVLLVLHA
jgi:hypothetical protein